ncbi:MAG: hypothetical protein ACYC3E_00815 [Carboxydocellales bacterium]
MKIDWEPIKAICDKATPGSWKVYETDTYENAIGTEWEHAQLKAPAPIVTVSVGVNDTKLYLEKNNAEFIITARTALPEAIAEIEQLRIKLEEADVKLLNVGIEFLHQGKQIEMYKAIEKAQAKCIEQLRQDKAELVHMLCEVTDYLDAICTYMKPDVIKRSNRLIAKHGGE